MEGCDEEQLDGVESRGGTLGLRSPRTVLPIPLLLTVGVVSVATIYGPEGCATSCVACLALRTHWALAKHLHARGRDYNVDALAYTCLTLETVRVAGQEHMVLLSAYMPRPQTQKKSDGPASEGGKVSDVCCRYVWHPVEAGEEEPGTAAARSTSAGGRSPI